MESNKSAPHVLCFSDVLRDSGFAVHGGKFLFQGLAAGLAMLGNAEADERAETFFHSDFERPFYESGSIHGQKGWEVDQGVAEVVQGGGKNGSAGLVIFPHSLFSQARLKLDTGGLDADAVYLDVQVRPVAGDPDRKEEMIDINSARVGLFRTVNGNEASVWIYDANPFGGEWLDTGVSLPVDALSGKAWGWHRLTLREDTINRVWDLWVDGEWAAGNVGFEELGNGAGAAYIFMGERTEALALDNLWIGGKNPLPEEALEKAAAPGKTGPDGFTRVRDPEAAVRMATEGNRDTDGDGMSDRNEELLGLDPLARNDVKSYLPKPSAEVFTHIQIPAVKRGLPVKSQFPSRTEKNLRKTGE